MVIQLGSNGMGRGDAELGKKLMKSFLNVLQEVDEIPSAVVLFNTGVFLACEGSDVLEPLKDLEEAGVALLSCGTCINHFNLEDKLKVGKISDMFEITNTMINADKVVSI
ncbi:MAG: sulfurtransferase-like selenium metabolism protein YedF [Candidatus Electryonea clarkiae]|nr:sulfurtransferase-like selenium metabolism protein YedF [Candidatus Electryonea clarkiae]MDP8289062.1 sulfurtransferase-like selenium metabolism protein YedF [Candidatus Electryonea clarkiae]